MVMGISGIVKVKLGYAQLEKAPEGFAQVGGETHQVQVCQVCHAHLAEVGVQEKLALFLVQRLVDGKVSQVEEEIAHGGVLPVQYPDGAPIVDEIAGEQVIVAGPRLLQRADGRFNLRHQTKYLGWCAGKSNFVLQCQR